MVETIQDALNYIIVKEGMISHYTEKMRETARRLNLLFRKKTYCAVCGLHKGTDMRDALQSDAPQEIKEKAHGCTEHDQVLNNPEFQVYLKYPLHTFTPAIDVTFYIKDSEPFYEVEEDEYSVNKYYLAFSDHHLQVEIYNTWNEEHLSEQIDLDELSRAALKALFNSGRIPKFLKEVQKFLDEKESEYKQASEEAEKIAQIVSLLTK
jgi:hypothetical protein